MEPLLLLNKPGNVPKPFKREQGWFCRALILRRCPCVIGQACCDGSMIAIGHADNEVRIGPSAHPNELDALPIQGMMGVDDRDPFHRWFVKGGSVL